MQSVEVKCIWEGRVGEQDTVVEPDAFVGVPETPLTDQDVADARYDAISRAIAFLAAEQAKYARQGGGRPGPEHEGRGPTPPDGGAFDKPPQ